MTYAVNGLVELQEEVASDCLYTLYNTITKSDIEVEHRRVRQEADICELLTQVWNLCTHFLLLIK